MSEPLTVVPLGSCGSVGAAWSAIGLLFPIRLVPLKKFCSLAIDSIGLIALVNPLPILPAALDAAPMILDTSVGENNGPPNICLAAISPCSKSCLVAILSHVNHSAGQPSCWLHCSLLSRIVFFKFGVEKQ